MESRLRSRTGQTPAESLSSYQDLMGKEVQEKTPNRAWIRRANSIRAHLGGFSQKQQAQAKRKKCLKILNRAMRKIRKEARALTRLKNG